MRQNDDFVAQLVEQLTLNQWAEGSSPSEVTENKPPTFVGGFLFMLVFLLFKQVVLTNNPIYFSYRFFTSNINFIRSSTNNIT